jgi:hypothetical protein
LWDSKTEFIEDLLVDVAHFGSENLDDDKAFEMALGLVSNHRDLLDSEEGRRKLLLEAIRMGVEHNYYNTIDSIPWQSFVSLSAAILGPLPADLRKRLEAAISDGSAEFVAKMAVRYERLCSLLGFRVKDQFEGGYELFATLATSVVEGLAIRHLSIPSMTDNFYVGASTVSDAREEWAPAAIGFLSLFDTFMEPDPMFDPRSMAERLRACGSIDEIA